VAQRIPKLTADGYADDGGRGPIRSDPRGPGRATKRQDGAQETNAHHGAGRGQPLAPPAGAALALEEAPDVVEECARAVGLFGRPALDGDA
jgi:hypothetical protein